EMGHSLRGRFAHSGGRRFALGDALVLCTPRRGAQGGDGLALVRSATPAHGTHRGPVCGDGCGRICRSRGSAFYLFGGLYLAFALEGRVRGTCSPLFCWSLGFHAGRWWSRSLFLDCLVWSDAPSWCLRPHRLWTRTFASCGCSAHVGAHGSGCVPAASRQGRDSIRPDDILFSF